jgi:hypothetical protein
MPAPALPYPLINSNRVSWSSVEIQVGNLRYLGSKSVNWSDELKPGDVMGTHAHRIGRTQGEQKLSAGLEMYFEEANVFIAALAAQGLVLGCGWKEVEFDVLISFRPRSILPITNVVLQNCRVTKDDNSHSQSIEALTTKFDLDPFDILRNGISSLGPNGLIPGVI